MLGFTVVNAQTMAHKISYIEALQYNSSGSTVEISFSVPEKINDLLVQISDNAGNTIFPDNKINFIGTYKRIIDMKKEGIYYLKINDNDERINRVLIIK